MPPYSSFSVLLTFLHLASAAQPSAPFPISAPLRSLPWASGKNSLNFLHTTDTHGWHAGHLQEPQYSADWGDYISFASHLHDRADADGSDLLLIDTGDRVEGNGLYDASDPKGYWTFNGIFEEQPIDVITSGNHELYLANTSRRESDVVVPAYRQNYIASNLDIRDLDADGQDAEFRPLAARDRKFTTKNNGIRILAFGFLFNFHNNANNTRVQPVQETIKEKWFQDALREKDVDLFLVAGHVPVRESEEYDAVYRAIRAVKWDTPIVFFGGHTHVRDFKRWEDKAMGIESGRYLETIGFLSMKGVKGGGSGHKEGDVETENEHEDGAKEEAIASMQRFKKSIQYNRMYIDNNLHSFHHHSNTTSKTFPTEHGRNVSAQIEHARQTLNLNHTYGCVPQTYWLNRAPYPSNDSLLSLLADRILPESFASYNASTPSTTLGKSETNTANYHHNNHKPSIILTNTGALRFDLFKGPFTLDSTFLISPFTSGFRMIRDVPFSAADRVLGLLNSEGPILRREEGEDGLGFGGNEMEGAVQEGLVRAVVPQRGFAGRGQENGEEEEKGWVESSLGRKGGGQIPLLSDDNPSSDIGSENPHHPSLPSLHPEHGNPDHPTPSVPGYTTHDDLGAAGDDTLHVPIRFFDVPNCVGSRVFFPAPNTTTITPLHDSDPASPEKQHSPSSPSPSPDKVDLVYNAFIEPWILSALEFLGEGYEKKDTEVAWGGRTMTEVVGGWVEGTWGCDEDRGEGV
ncbi:hypothetical protein NU195Hw_g2098t1 [Hortaea werneckii]